MQSCLERRSMSERHVEIARSDYQRNNQYSATHPDALATGDAQGKGTGHMGHSHWLPNCNGAIGLINYSNFDTNPASRAGNNDDNLARDVAMARSLYYPGREYSATLVDTSANVREGQYVVS